MSVLKVIEVLANSEKSWDDATRRAIKKASKSVKNIKSAYVQHQSITVEDDKIKDYRVNLKVTFEVN